MSSYVVVSLEDVKALGLNGTLVEESELQAARAIAAAALSHPQGAPEDVDEDGPQEPQEGASDAASVDLVAGPPKKPRRARQPAGEGGAGQLVPDDPAIPGANEACEPGEA